MEAGLTLKNLIAHKIDFADFYHQCIHNGYGCTIYRLPQRKTIHMIIDLSGGCDLDKVNIETLNGGFVFHPFSSENHPIKFLNNDIHIVLENPGQNPRIVNSILSEEEISEKFQKDIKTDIEKHHERLRSTVSEIDPSDHGTYIELIDHTIDEIRSDQFQKAVISRTKKIELDEQFDPVRLFNALSSKYENAFVHLTHFPKVGTWAGTTPETLLSIDKNGKFETVALAATQSFNPAVGIEDTTWSQKDIEEQAMVSRYIINCFKKIRLREFDEIGPRTYLSGNLVHLKTNYIVDMKQVEFPELGSVMLDLLHPTSAVCGMPKEITKDFIEEYEGFDREYFSGYLGPVNIMDETNIFVNLRCAKLGAGQAQLYAGAGIIANSNPEKEWKETEIKMDTVLSVLNAL